MKSRLRVVLLLALLSCALLLVQSQNEARHLFVELEREDTQTKQLQVEWAQLQVDQSNLSKHARIQASAVKELNMEPVTTGRTEYIKLGSTQPEHP
jgi:cell division protein FtsL